MSKPIDWTRIRYLMRRSIRGKCEPWETGEIMKLYARVMKECEGERWGRIHADEKRYATEEMNPLA